MGVILLSILTKHLIQVETLPFHHRDPFDRLILAQALVENCVVVSKDGNFPLYSIPLMWN